MIAVVDTSALLKLLLVEDESAALRTYLSETGDTLAMSTLGVVEMRRALIRLGQDPALVAPFVAPLAKTAITQNILNVAALLPAQHLGTLDAIHLASALAVGAETFVTYDKRLAEAARTEGLRVAAPGQDAA